MASGDDFEIWVPPNALVRERAVVPSVDLASLDAIQGYMIPGYIDELEDGRRVAQLREKDFQRVVDGYACGNCLAFFGQKFKNCPSCSHSLDPNKDIVEHAPEYWNPVEGRTSDEILNGRR